MSEAHLLAHGVGAEAVDERDRLRRRESQVETGNPPLRVGPAHEERRAVARRHPGEHSRQVLGNDGAGQH
jgi:hypothetical protein